MEGIADVEAKDIVWFHIENRDPASYNTFNEWSLYYAPMDYAQAMQRWAGIKNELEIGVLDWQYRLLSVQDGRRTLLDYLRCPLDMAEQNL